MENGISIIGSHDFKKLESFTIENVAWMSKKMQKDFLKIFEGGERFNILPSLRENLTEIKKCRHGHYYNSIRYRKCPVDTPDDKSLEKFRLCDTDDVPYDEKFSILPSKEVRKIANKTAYFDYNKNAISITPNLGEKELHIGYKVDDVYFAKNGSKIVITKISKIKQFFGKLFGKYRGLKNPYREKSKDSSQKDNPICRLEIFNSRDEKIYSTLILKKTYDYRVTDDSVYFINSKNHLIRVCFSNGICNEQVLYSTDNYYIYEVSKNSNNYCICEYDGTQGVVIKVNQRTLKKVNGVFPKFIRWDAALNNWCVITKNIKSGGYSFYVSRNNTWMSKKFIYFSFSNCNIANCIFYNQMLLVPENKKIIFFISGDSVATSKVREISVGILNENSKISIEEDKYGHTNLIVQNNKQIYRIRLS